MNKNLYARLITAPDDPRPDPSELNGLGYVVRPFPEVPVGEDFAALANRTGSRCAQLWTWTFKSEPNYCRAVPIEALDATVFERSYAYALIQFDHGDVGLWIEDANNFSLLFGPEAHVLPLPSTETFDYTFDEFIAADIHTDVGRTYYRSIWKRYVNQDHQT